MVEKADLTTVVIPQPFASEGDKNVIPVADGGTNAASWNLGFPPKTSLPYDEDGLPPDRYDFNGVINATTNAQYNIQLGIQPTFDQNVSNAIGGYPKGSILMYDDGNGNVIYVQSLKENNTANFNTTPSYIDDGTNWATVIPTRAWVQGQLTGSNLVKAPNYSAAQRLTLGQTYTASTDGWLLLSICGNTSFTIGGFTFEKMGGRGQNYESNAQSVWYVTTGTSYTVPSTNVLGNSRAYWIPTY